MNIVIPRAFDLLKDLKPEAKGKVAYKRLGCLLTKIHQNEKDVIDTYVSYLDFSTYLTLAAGGKSRDELIASGYVDQAGNRIKFQHVKDFLKRPFNFDPTLTDIQYRKLYRTKSRAMSLGLYLYQSHSRRSLGLTLCDESQIAREKQN